MKRVGSILLLLVVMLAGMNNTVALASTPMYQGYNYSYWGEAEPAPLPYLPASVIRGDQTKAGAWQSPEDFYTMGKRLYVLDTGNNRVIIMNHAGEVQFVIDHFMNNGVKDTFNGPQGIFVDEAFNLYVADTLNKRIVILSPEGELKQIVGPPESEMLKQGFQYVPIKVTVDHAKRLYVVSKGTFEGIIVFDESGSFTNFIGQNPVKFDAADLFWKQISTKEQQDKMIQFIPVEFNNVGIDDEGFIYATVADPGSEKPVKRLNPSGDDVLRRWGNFSPEGDIQYAKTGSMAGKSAFAAVEVESDGIYSVLDSRRGRIFTYDRDGNFMYQFGQLGNRAGTFKIPVAIHMWEDKMLVLDKELNQITVFELTRYGRLIKTGVTAYNRGEHEIAAEAWKEAQRMNANLELAYIGIGKTELKEGANQAAMESYQLGNSKPLYSKAFERFRKAYMMEHFTMIVAGLFAVLAIVIFLARRLGKTEVDDYGVLRYSIYNAFHPFKGFWELKYEKRGRLWFVFALLGVLTLTFIVKRQYAGFVVNYNQTDKLNSLMEVLYVLLPFFLWCVANWALTTLMEGEGTFRDILMATGYALIPVLVIYIPQILFSQVITEQEAAFYYFFETAAYVWSAGLLFVGMMTIHQYSASKTILTMLLTLLVMGIIIFLGLLFFTFIQQIINFVTTIYEEVAYRLQGG
ncbi:YIP1 family protein [Paenibacillus sp. GCM10027626]|uniref:YIP1 family protein n=1 Tax=Paenibacillus sp. GCM10027626 TaxID=3273411 RepID=UPI0036357E21